MPIKTTPSSRSYPKSENPVALAIMAGVSQSERTVYDNCHYRWYLEYVERWKSFEPEFILSVGSLFHKGMEEIAASQGKKFSRPKFKFNKLATLTEDDAYEQNYWENVLMILFEEYIRYYADDFEMHKVLAIEKVLHLTVEGIPLVGAPDRVTEYNGRAQMWDHKTQKMKKEKDGKSVESWETRFQFLLYTYIWNQLYPQYRVGYFLADLISKPAISQKQTENPAQFFNRLRADIRANPSHYFKRERFPLTQGLLDNFYHHSLRPKIDKFKLLLTVQPGTIGWNALVMDRNDGACFSFGRRCPFFLHCHQGHPIEKLKVYKREIKHEHHIEKN